MTQTSSFCASQGHPSYLNHKGVCRARHRDDSGRAQSHKPALFHPSRFLSSSMLRTRSFSLYLSPSHKHTHSDRAKRKRQTEEIRRVGQGESAAPAKNPVTGRMATEGRPPDTTRRSRASGSPTDRHTHITRSMHNQWAAERQSLPAGWIRLVLLSL